MHILVVEDDIRISDHIKRGLEQVQFTVTCVFSAKEALAKVEHFTYDVIILDLLLPDMSGVHACREMRKMQVTTPIIMLTSQSDVESRVEGLDAGADDYLCKPFSFEELVARVRALLRRGEVHRDPILRIGDISLDPSCYTAFCKGESIELTSREYGVLEYLMRHPGQVCTKLMLEEHVWGSRYEQESNIIEVTLSRLRKKMEEVGAPHFIVTRHGLGYLVEPVQTTATKKE